MTDYRKLTSKEIEQLKNQGCRSKTWERINVSELFNTSAIYQSVFSGDIHIAGPKEIALSKESNFEISGSRLHNCRLAENVRIINADWISNYDIEKNVVIENLGELSMSKESYFGNGVTLDILNEGGGRELIIYDKLSAQIAYLQVLYRHDKEFSDKLEKIIRSTTESKKSNRGKICENTSIRHCTALKDIYMGPHARLRGVQRMENGSIISTAEDPVFIGSGVIADHFIIQSGSKIDSGVILDHCFVGQAVKLGKQFSAENSAFFANSEGFHGEACSVFAGPYTVSHHKSSLLIAGLYSFYNAGSGTNMSNHMYKLGPVHQSILERGSKTGSFSYLLAPSRVGAFTAVIGKHSSNFDSSEFPFSYITEEKGKSTLTPAMNLLTVGTRRDSEKWPKRDKRKGILIDLIHFELFSPVIVEKMKNARNILMKLYKETDKSRESLIIHGLHIYRLMLKTSAKYYELGLKIYCGQMLEKMIESTEGTIIPSELLRINEHPINDKWVDISGLFCPQSSLEQLMNELKSGHISTSDQLQNKLEEFYNNYEKNERKFASALICERSDKTPDEFDNNDLKTILDDGAKAFIKLNNLILSDAGKEFDPTARIGYGIDGDDSIQKADFEAVRGSVEENAFICDLQEKSRLKQEIVNKLLERL